MQSIIYLTLSLYNHQLYMTKYPYHTNNFIYITDDISKTKQPNFIIKCFNYISSSIHNKRSV
jgi:hypothetical protein